MEFSPLVEQGIAAYKAGNKDEAVRLLTQAVRDNAQDENAWLYLGAAVDGADRKIDAFKRVLQINPYNERAKNALTRLGIDPETVVPPASSGASSGYSASSASGSSRSSAGTGSVPPPGNTDPDMGGGPGKSKDTGTGGPTFRDQASQRLNEGFKLPFDVPGAPPVVTMPYVIDTTQMRVQEATHLFTTMDFDTYEQQARGASMWDSVFLVLVACAVTGAAEFVGRLIGWPLSGFYLGIGGLLGVFFGAIISMIATAAGFFAAVYGSRYYLQNQNINVPRDQHSMYFAMVWFPVTIINAAFTLLSTSLGFLIACLFPIFAIAGVVLLVYSWFLLKGAFERVYGTANNRGIITAAIAVVGGAVGSGIVRLVLFPIFRLH